MTIQGIYVLADRERERIFAEVRGDLASRASSGDVEVLFEGVLTGGRDEDHSDANVALRAWRNGGIPALRRLDGFYSVAVVECDKVTLVCDSMATRPQWVYSKPGVCATAPTPVWFADKSLSMSFDRLGFYQSLRLMHGVGARTLVDEVSRNRPLTVYTFHGDGRLDVDSRYPIRQEVDDRVTVDRAAEEIRDLLADVMSGLFSHPKIRERTVHLPLTAGMDSRHILAQLRSMGRTPASIRQVFVNQPEASPVQLMTKTLGIPLHMLSIDALDYDALHPHWLRCSGGLVHHHQLFLMGVLPSPEEVAENPQGFVGFDGYLADKLVGFACRHQLLQRRFYAHAALPLLFSQRSDLERRTLAEIDAEYALWDGNDEFKNGGTDTFNRGPTYTGGIFPILSGAPGAGDVQYFAPTAHARAFEFFRRTPYAVAGKKRARLRMFRSHFPEEGAFPAEDGRNLIDRESLEQPGGGGIPWSVVRRFVVGLAPGGEPMPDTEHAWVRGVRYWNEVTRRATFESKLAEDGQVRGATMRAMWRSQQAGAFVAWTLMGLVTGEVAYRALVLREPVSDVARWLWPSSRTCE